MKSTTLVVLLVVCFLAGCSTVGRPESRTPATYVELWPNGAPGAKGDAVTDKPAIAPVLAPTSCATGTAVIVNPGGGYGGLASDYEGLQVARWLNRQGISAFVLRYRLKPDYEPSDALADAQRAIRYVRYHANEYGVSPTRIGMMGFSAGGHLTSAAGTQYDAGNPDAEDPIDRVGCRPDFLGLIYAVVSGDLFDEKHQSMAPTYQPTDALVTGDTPPTFLFSTTEDTLVSPKHEIAFYQALLKAGVPAEMHVFGYGEHGVGLAVGDPEVGKWPELFASWIRRAGFQTDAARTAVSGQVLLDGKPLYWGWVTFIPENPTSPSARAYIFNRAEGKFSIDAAHGLVPGKHRVEVTLVSRDFSEPKTGGFSMEDSETYVHPRPDAQGPIVVDVTAGKEVRVAIETK